MSHDANNGVTTQDREKEKEQDGVTTPMPVTAAMPESPPLIRLIGVSTYPVREAEEEREREYVGLEYFFFILLTQKCNILNYSSYNQHTRMIEKKIDNSIDFLRHADEIKFSIFSLRQLGKFGQIPP